MTEFLAAKRPPFVFWACLVGVGAAVPLVYIANDLLVPNSTHVPGRDFVTFWAAGRFAVLGDPVLAYDQAAILRAVYKLLGITTAPAFVYPPPALLVLAPFGLFSYPLALALWTVAGAALFACAARPFVRFAPILAILTPAALFNIWDGQFGFVVGALWLFAFRLVDQPLPGGLAAGLLILKPHLALLAAPRLLLALRTAGVAVLVAGLGALLTIDLWAVFFASVSLHSAYVSEAAGSFFFRLMPSAYSSYGQSWPMHMAFAGGAVGLLAYYRRFDCFSLATATFLILPYAHNYDMTVACLGFAVLLHRRWALFGWAQRTAFAMAYLSPSLTIIAPWLVPPILLAALWQQQTMPRLEPPASRSTS